MIQGVDRSHNNDPVKLASLVPKGIGFIYFKATQGATFKDPAFNASWQEIKAIPGNLSGQLMKRGAYHFYDPRIDGIVQAKNYLSCGVNFAVTGCLPPCVDVEDLTGSDAVDANKWVMDNYEIAISRLTDFLNYIKQETGRDCLIYTYNNYPKEYFRGHGFHDNPMWLSSLQETCPVRYDTGKLPEFWQNTYQWQGTGMDGDLFTGTMDGLNAMANIS